MTHRWLVPASLYLICLSRLAGADSLDLYARRTQTLRPAEPALVGHASMAARRERPHVDVRSGMAYGYVVPSYMGGPSFYPKTFQTVRGDAKYAWIATVAGVERGDRVRLETQGPSAPLRLHAQRIVAAHVDESLHLQVEGRSFVADAHARVDVEREPVRGGAALSALARQGKLMSLRSALRAAQRWDLVVDERAQLAEVERDAFGPKHRSPAYRIEREAALDFRTPVRVIVDDDRGRRQFVRTTTVQGGAHVRTDMELGEAYYTSDADPVRWRIGPGGPTHRLYQETVNANRDLGVRMFLEGKVGGGTPSRKAPVWVQTENIWATPAYVHPTSREAVATIVGLAALPLGAHVRVVNRTLSERLGGSVESETTVTKRSGSFSIDIRAPVAGCKYSISISGPGESRVFDFTLPEGDPERGAGLREIALVERDR